MPAGCVGCDVDHDLAWPFGPTCACNTGPFADLDPCGYYDARFGSDPSDPWLDGAITDGLPEQTQPVDEDPGRRWLLDEPWYLRVHDDSAWTEPPLVIDLPD